LSVFLIALGVVVGTVFLVLSLVIPFGV
jgi:hypothetical protein